MIIVGGRAGSYRPARLFLSHMRFVEPVRAALRRVLLFRRSLLSVSVISCCCDSAQPFSGRLYRKLSRVDADPSPPELLCRHERGAGAGKGVEHKVSGVCRGFDNPPEQRFRFLCGVTGLFTLSNVHTVGYVVPDIAYKPLVYNSVRTLFQEVLDPDLAGPGGVDPSFGLEPLYRRVGIVAARGCLEGPPLAVALNVTAGPLQRVEPVEDMLTPCNRAVLCRDSSRIARRPPWRPVRRNSRLCRLRSFPNRILRPV